ncbi:MAG: nucleotidyltransferase family protein [Haloarculaceae archaeon]
MTADTTRQRNGSPRTDGGPQIGAILLAAGQSTRFESGNKLLAPVDGTPIVRHAAETLLDAAVADVVVIVGQDDEAVRNALSGLPVSFRVNPDYAEGQSTSVRVGVETARERDWDAAVFALGDMPFVDPSSVDALLDRYASGDVSIVAAAYDGKRGNPVLFDSTHYETLADVTGDVGGRHLIETREDTVLVETDDPGVVRDIDDEADLAKYTD